MPLPLPTALLAELSRSGHFDTEAFVEAHREENKITSIRMNSFKSSANLAFDCGEAVPWANDAYYLATRPSFTFDPLFHAGRYYVQEAGSMFLEFALQQTLDLSQKLKVLDLCAAPGGKSTLINSLLSADSLLVSNEFIRSRADILAQNLSKWGSCNSVVTNNDPQRFSDLPGFFDILVIDAPCSGSGLFRKQPEAILEWSEDQVNVCSIRQKKILEDALPSLKEGGILIYSTCSYSEKENEYIVNWMVKTFEMEYIPLSVDPNWGLVETEGGYRFYPHLTRSEGFFCSVLRKTGGETARNLKRKASEITKAELGVISPYLEMPVNAVLFKENNRFHLLNETALDFLTGFEKQLYFKKAGVLVGDVKGKDLVPDHELALSLYLSDSVERLDLDLDTALKYLRKEVFPAPSDARGLHLITYLGLGIGWAKLLPNRVNNYLPPELRILSRDSA